MGKDETFEARLSLNGGESWHSADSLERIESRLEDLGDEITDALDPDTADKAANAVDADSGTAAFLAAYLRASETDLVIG